MLAKFHFGKMSVAVALLAMATAVFYVWGIRQLPNDLRFLGDWVSPLSAVLAFVAIGAALLSFLISGDKEYSLAGFVFALVALFLNLIIVAVAVFFFVVLIVSLVKGGN